MMLQEDFVHPITRYLSWYACHLRVPQLPAAVEPDSDATLEPVEEGVSTSGCHFGSLSQKVSVSGQLGIRRNC